MNEGSERAFKALLLEMGQVRQVDDLLTLIVGRLMERPTHALARIWLKRPGDICGSCHVRDECPDRTECLQLVASAGRPEVATHEDWSYLDGHFRRMPMGVRKVGHIAASGGPVEVADVRNDREWIARHDWAREEGILGFAGQPLIANDEVLGVLAVFTRVPVDPDTFEWLRMIADHAAGAIANAEAFEEIQALRNQLQLENAYLREEVGTAGEAMIGSSAAMGALAEQIRLVGPTDATCLITGESGTGKELVARAIHRNSSRADKPLIKVNCASIPPQLYESEFFGHVKGSFTGAVLDRSGRFEAAHGGTLFLDEVGEIPLDLQSKLLRVLQERQYERVGEERTRDVDVRIVAATNRDLTTEIAEGRFRQDLFYRLNVFPLHIPALRDREGDLAMLAEHFLERFARKMQKATPRLTQALLGELARYDWPGNVRELQNVIERAVITARGRGIRFDLPNEPRRPAREIPTQTQGDVLPELAMRDRERANIVAALQKSGGKVSGSGGAAEILGVAPTTLAYRIKKFGIERER